MARVFAESEASGSDRLVLLAIADEADDDGTSAYPSQDRIAAKARMSKATTQRAIGRLEEAGEIVVIRPERKGRGHFNRYELPRYATAKGRQSDTLSEAGNGSERPEKARPGEALPTDPKTRSKSSRGGNGSRGRGRGVLTEETRPLATAWYDAAKAKVGQVPGDAFTKVAAVAASVLRGYDYTPGELTEALRRIAPTLPNADRLANQAYGVRRENERDTPAASDRPWWQDEHGGERTA